MAAPQSIPCPCCGAQLRSRGNRPLTIGVCPRCKTPVSLSSAQEETVPEQPALVPVSLVEPPPVQQDERRPPRRSHRQPGSAVPSLGLGSVLLGMLALPFSLFPCIGWLSLPLSGLGCICAAVALIVAIHEGDDRVGLPIAGAGINALAFSFGFLWLRWWWLNG